MKLLQEIPVNRHAIGYYGEHWIRDRLPLIFFNTRC